MNACPACGHETDHDARFCSRCGEKVAGNESTTIMAALEDTTLINALSSDDMIAIDALPIGSALLVVLKGPAAGARFLIHQERTVAGRHPDSDIFLDDITVSRSHAAFTRSQDTFIVEDLRSLNGTYLNRKLLDAPDMLRNGDEVQIGKYKLVYFMRTAGTD